MTLKRRLVLFFAAVVAVAGLSSFLLVRLSTETLFRSFVFSGDSAKAERYAASLGAFYAERGNWDGADHFLTELSPSLYSRSESAYGMHSSEQDTVLADRIVLVDKSGVVIADSSGELLGTVHPSRHLSHGIPITVNSEQRGTVLVGSMVDSSLRGTGERFLFSVTGSLIASSLLSAALALALGLLFAARVTRPVVSLNAAVKRIASGDLSAVVPEGSPSGGRDEISELSASFNKMARELEKLEDAKKRIIADVAHELRTPTTLIRGTIEGMLDGIFPLDASLLRTVHEETLRLSKLIDTLRELELIESGRMKLEKTEVDIAETAAKAVSLFAAAAQDQGIRLIVDIADSKPRAIQADSFRLDEVVYNLLSNALKYAGSGGRVRLSLADDAESAGVRFSVDDTGPGIPAAEREKIFERFYRTDSSRCSDLGGRGLGLAIVREIVKAHGGSVSVADSDLGGASFIVRLPG
ncbi:MAG: ATP-binding protein [Treponemataceae bacterium]